MAQNVIVPSEQRTVWIEEPSFHWDELTVSASHCAVEPRKSSAVKALPAKHCSPSSVTAAGIVMELREVQFWNAIRWMDVTLSGIPMDVKEVQPEKAA